MLEPIEPEARKAAEQRPQAHESASALRNAIGDINHRQHLRLDHELAEYRRLIFDAVKNRNEVGIDMLQGITVEAHHVGSYNVNAAAQGDSEHRARLAPPGHMTTDIITEGYGGRTVESQVKFFATPERTASALSKGRYTDNDVDKIVPHDQYEKVVRIANDRAGKNRTSNPQRSTDYDHTARNTKSHVSHPDNLDIKSDDISRGQSEKLAKEARGDQQVEYPDSENRQAQLQELQYINAAKAGAIGGAVYSTAGEVIRLMQRRGELSQKDLEQALYNVLIGTAKGAGGTLLTTGVQHAGRVMSEKAAGDSVTATVGRSLSKSHVAPVVASIATQFAQDIGRMCNGEIDGIEMAESTINSACQDVARVGGNALGRLGGKALWPYVANIVGEKVAAATVFGMPMGLLGPVLTGMVGGALAAMAAGAYINHCQQKGVKLAVRDLEASFDAMQCGKLDLVGYVGEVGKMSELRFSWGDLLPLSGSFAVFGEYRVRKAQLKAMEEKIQRARADLSEQEQEIMWRMREHYEKQVTRIEEHFTSQDAELLDQFDMAFQHMEQDLDTHLSLQHKLFAARNVDLITHLDQLHRDAVADEQTQAETAEAKSHIQALLEDLERHKGIISPKQRTLMRQALDARLSGLLPNDTPADLVQRFMATSQGFEHAV